MCTTGGFKTFLVLFQIWYFNSENNVVVQESFAHYTASDHFAFKSIWNETIRFDYLMFLYQLYYLFLFVKSNFNFEICLYHDILKTLHIVYYFVMHWYMNKNLQLRKMVKCVNYFLILYLSVCVFIW